MFKYLRAGLMLCLCIGVAQAQGLDDPTRPTSAVTPPVETAIPERPEPPSPRFRADDHRLSQTYVLASIRRARINGRWFNPGATLHDGIITAITETSVTITTPQRDYVLTIDTARATFSLNEEVP